MLTQRIRARKKPVREADHRGDLAGLLHGPDDRVDVLRLEAAEPAVIVLDAFPALRPTGETFRWRDTLRNRGPAELLVEW